jgi:hypothetical protein
MPDFAGDTTTELERKIGPLKVVCILETFSYLLLLSVWLGLGSHIGTLIVGSVHGMIVTAFALMVLFIYRDLGWTWQFAAVAIITGPIGAVLVYERLRRGANPAPASTRPRPSMDT